MSMTHEITDGLAHKRSKRKGRGDSSGKGKTAGKGTKGTKARSGKKIRRGYEGGQTETYRRFPKRGFSNFDFTRRFYVVNLPDLEEKFDAGTTIDAQLLKEAGLIPNLHLPVKILANGEVKKSFTIQAGWYSKTAADAIVAAGGTLQDAKGGAFAFPKPKKKFVKREPVKAV